MIKILVKFAAILLLLRILGGYAQVISSLSLTLPTQKTEIDSAEVYSVNAAPSVQKQTTCTDRDDSGCEDLDINDAGDIEDNDGNDASEIDDTEVPPLGQTGITPQAAQAAAEAANPGANTLAVEIDRMNENDGALIYEVELDNGIDVKVDASNGYVLATDMRDAN